MESIQEFLSAYRTILYTILFTLVVAVLVMKYWDKVKFWWLCTWASFPVIGKISKLSKDTESMEGNNWFSSETSLCSDFYAHYDRYDKDAEHYDRCKSYLSKVDELGRKPFPSFMWLIVFVLVLLEAAGFAYVLAGFTIPGASEAVQQYGAFGIAIIISIILVGFTHWTGHEIYKNSLIKKIRVWYINDRRDDKPNLERDDRITLETNNLDDNAPNYIKVLNRVNTNATVTPSWMISIITAIFVVVIAVGATYVRGQVLEKQLIEEVSNIQTDVYSAFPMELVGNQEKADTKALEDRQDSDRKGGWATFIVLAVLFVFIQLLGILFGFKWGFVGKESLNSYLDYHNFRTKQDFISYFKKEKEKIAKIAQQKLQNLQQRMFQNASLTGTSSKQSELIRNKEHRTFLNYVVMQHQESENHNIEITKVTSSSVQKKVDDIKLIIEEKSIKVFCSECGSELGVDSKFCPNCGNKVETKVKVPTCPECNTVYEDGLKFCPKDGAKLELA
ncbi:zinc ribbon domain-containing protein [Arcobacter sp. FWKO B]|uniref:zinc ribbon domain-containing protein n=1 Tax=Arcobacter sp. FWKO B TaxID=2593672 RepID=UPI0018A62E33|nr:zinc ribbon domain-containing protein [Arcobacter sp. FWKO B]QOG11940.1 zinc ribbon domain-containing protein [Arcobacter sp. FWKO B]